MRLNILAASGFLVLLHAHGAYAAPQSTDEPLWSATLLDQLCRTYGQGASRPSQDPAPNTCLDQVATEIGRQLSINGAAGVPVQDVAALALLLSQSGLRGGAFASATADPRAQSPADDRGSDRTRSQLEAEPLSDIGKGQEGFAQGVDRLTDLPLSERMVVTGDITSGFQAATVSDGPELTSAFGRARVNFVTRAAPGSDDGTLSPGYFFVQMIAAGGAFDTSPVGGPSALSPINDVATDRSDFNQGASRGNLYLKKAFYQQELNLGNQGSVLGRLGVISLSDLFDTSEFANNESRQFLNAALVNSPAFKGGIGAPGFMFEYRRGVDLAGVEELAVRTGYGITRTFRALTSPVWTNEVQARVRVGGRVGTYRAGVTVGNVPDAGGLNGVHFGVDQWLFDDIGVFGRYARSNSGPGALALGPVRQSYSAGLQWRFGEDVERVSAWGLGFSQGFPIADLDRTVSERVLETYYRRQFTPNLSLTPDLQVVLGSGGQSERATHFVGSLRVAVGF